VLKTLHAVKHILNEEECRSVGKARGWWWHDFAVVIAMKPSVAVQETLGVLEEYRRELWYDITAGEIKSKLCSGIRLCRHTSPLLIIPSIHRLCTVCAH